MSKGKADFGTLEKENKRTNSFAPSWKTTSLRSFFFFFLSFFLSDNFFFLTSKNFQSGGQLSSSCFEVFAKTALRKQDFGLCENKGAVQLCSNCTADQRKNCAVNAQLISTFVFATLIVLSLLYLNPKFQASSLLQ